MDVRNVFGILATMLVGLVLLVIAIMIGGFLGGFLVAKPRGISACVLLFCLPPFATGAILGLTKGVRLPRLTAPAAAALLVGFPAAISPSTFCDPDYYFMLPAIPMAFLGVIFSEWLRRPPQL